MSYTQQIYNRLRQHGITEAGALGMLGNFQCESGCEPGRLQGDFSPYRNNSKAYVQGVEDGSITRQQFGSDRKGFGLAQWTYCNPQNTAGRKFDLYDFWHNSGRKLDSAELQTDFALHELTTEGQYAELWQFLKTTNDVFNACSRICRVYEQPYYNNIDARFQAAQTIKSEIDLNGWEAGQTEEPKEEPQTGWENIPATEYWPPRMICRGMNGDDILVLKAILAARGFGGLCPDVDGYLDGDSDIFDAQTETDVMQFQKAFGLDADGIVGPLTWGKLFER